MVCGIVVYLHIIKGVAFVFGKGTHGLVTSMDVHMIWGHTVSAFHASEERVIFLIDKNRRVFFFTSTS